MCTISLSIFPKYIFYFQLCWLSCIKVYFYAWNAAIAHPLIKFVFKGLTSYTILKSLQKYYRELRYCGMWTHVLESVVSEVLKSALSFQKLAATHPIKQNHIPDYLNLLRSSDEVIIITIIIVIISECSQRWLHSSTLD